MTFEVRLAVVALAAFAWAGLLGTMLAAWLWRRSSAGRPLDRAGRLLRIRLIPIGAAGAASALAIVSFLLFEPRTAHESTGWILSGLAVLTCVLFARAAVHGVAVVRTTRLAIGTWMAGAEPIDIADVDVPAFAITSPFPVVAVVGLWRPRLVIARSVLEVCSADEVRAIGRHERHHLDRRDNLRRAVLALAPDVLGLLPVSRRLLRAWHEATEEAADDFAKRASDRGGVTLAGALLKVARLAPAGSFATALPASALYRGENLERRVHRLLLPESDAIEPSGPSGRIALLMTGALVLCALTLDRMHAAMETAINLLP